MIDKYICTKTTKLESCKLIGINMQIPFTKTLYWNVVHVRKIRSILKILFLNEKLSRKQSFAMKTLVENYVPKLLSRWGYISHGAYCVLQIQFFNLWSWGPSDIRSFFQFYKSEGCESVWRVKRFCMCPNQTIYFRSVASNVSWHFFSRITNVRPWF